MNTYRHPVTPAELSRPLKALCQKIVPNQPVPIYVDVHPLQGAPSKECFPIVEQYIQANGGSSAIGWSLWELPELFIEAEFHAVWKSPEGALVDISPKTEPTKRILFLPDPSRVYEGRQVNNFRMALRQDPVVIGFLRKCDEEYEFLNRGERAEQHRLSLESADIIEYQRIQITKEEFWLQMLSLLPAAGPYSPCLCGSGRKIKWCHGA